MKRERPIDSSSWLPAELWLHMIELDPGMLFKMHQLSRAWQQQTACILSRATEEFVQRFKENVHAWCLTRPPWYTGFDQLAALLGHCCHALYAPWKDDLVQDTLYAEGAILAVSCALDPYVSHATRCPVVLVSTASGGMSTVFAADRDFERRLFCPGFIAAVLYRRDLDARYPALREW